MAKSFNAQMQARFRTITSSIEKANNYIHDTAMMIAAHASEHGDCSTAQGLVMALPASMRREMLILWFAKFTPIVVKNDDKWVAKAHKPDTKLYVAYDLEAGQENPFFKLAEENKEKGPMDFEALLKLVSGLARRIEKKVEDGDVAEGLSETALLIARQLSAIHVEKPVVASNDTGGTTDDVAVA